MPKRALSRTAKAASETVPQHPDAAETLRIAVARLDDMKAEDIVTVDLAGKTTIADYMVVATGRSARHVASTAEQVIKDLNQAGIKRIRAEGLKQGDWVLIDAGDVIVHLFRDEVRAFYNLEKMWTGGKADGKEPN